MFELNKKNITKIIGIITFTVLFIWLINNFNNFSNIISFIIRLITPFLIGFVIAFILNIPVRFFERIIKARFEKKNKNKHTTYKPKTYVRLCTVLLSILIIIGIISFVLFLVIPELVNTFKIVKQNFPNIVNSIKEFLENLTQNYPELNKQIQSFNINWEDLSNSIPEFFKTHIGTVISSSVNIAMSVITSITNTIIAFVFALFLLLQKEKLITSFKKIFFAYMKKEHAEKLISFGKLTNNTFSRFVGGQFIESCILGTLCFIGMIIFRFDYATTISILVGVASLVPMFGAFIGAIIGILLLLAINPAQAFWFLVFFIVIQQIEGNFIYPKVVGNSVGLPGIWVMVAVTIGGGALGIIGMMIGVPTASVIYKLLRKNVNKKNKEKNIQIES